MRAVASSFFIIFFIKMLYFTKQNITEKKLETVLTILQILTKKKKKKKLHLNFKKRGRNIKLTLLTR